MKLLITGDLVINQSYKSSNIDQNVIDLFKQSDLNIVNLEAPVTNSTSKILKTGPHLKSNENSALDVLKALKVDVVTLANNHILDYDKQGVEDTLAFCKNNDFKSVGAGMNVKEASKTYFIETKEGRIGIVNFAENEWASATANSAGANPMDIIDNAEQIKEARHKADFVFVIVHGGHEYYNLPSPKMQKQYRFYAEQGADIVIGHHTHCINGNEMHKGVPIYYSLGNFLFTKSSNYEDWYLGLVLEIEIKKGKLKSILHPVEQKKESFQLTLLEKDEKKAILSRVSALNTIISNPEKLMNKWEFYVVSKYKSYINYWSPINFINNRYLKAVLNKLGIKLINKKGISYLLNLMRCEAHSYISIAALQKYLRK